MLESYSEGFLTKCAEYDIPFETAFEMLKIASAGSVGGMEKDAWNYTSDAVAGMINPWWGGGRATAPIATSSDNFIRKNIGQRNTNFMGYLDKVDSGQAGTALGRAWHGINDNWIGRNIFGIRGSDKYIEDMEDRRMRKATDLANDAVRRQQHYQDLLNNAPQLDQLEVSNLRGYQQRTSANPKAIPKMKTTFGSNRRNGQGGYQRPGYQRPGYQRPGSYRSPYQYRPRMAGGNEYA